MADPQRDLLSLPPSSDPPETRLRLALRSTETLRTQLKALGGALQCLVAEEVTPSTFLNMIQKAKFVHLLAHGLPERARLRVSGDVRLEGYNRAGTSQSMQPIPGLTKDSQWATRVTTAALPYRARTTAPHLQLSPDLPTIASPQTFDWNAGRLFACHLLSKTAKADVVVLQVCSAGDGMLTASGENTDSIGLALLHAGVGTVLAPCWKIDVEQSTELLQTFYAQLQHLPPVIALTAAMRALLPPTAPGDYWAQTRGWGGFMLLCSAM